MVCPIFRHSWGLIPTTKQLVALTGNVTEEAAEGVEPQNIASDLLQHVVDWSHSHAASHFMSFHWVTLDPGLKTAKLVDSFFVNEFDTPICQLVRSNLDTPC